MFHVKQTIHMKYKVLFFLKNNEKIFKTVACCSRDWHLNPSALRKAKIVYSFGLHECSRVKG